MRTTIQLKSKQRKVNMVYWPTEKKVLGAIQIIHGASEYIERYDSLALFLNENGFDVYGHTHIGHGIAGKTIHFGFGGKKSIERDCIIVSDYLSGRYQNYFVIAHSMGSLILRNLLADKKISCQAVILSGTGYTNRFVSFCGLSLLSVFTIFRPRNVSDRFNKMVFNFAHDWIANDPKAVQSYFDDPKCGHHFSNSALRVLVSFAYHANAKKTFKNTSGLPILLISGQNDPFGQKGKGIKKIQRLYQSCGVEASYILYPNMKHEIFNESDKLTVFEDVLNFIVNHYKY